MLLLANDVQECASLVSGFSVHFKETNIFMSVSQMLKLSQNKKSFQVLEDVCHYLRWDVMERHLSRFRYSRYFDTDLDDMYQRLILVIHRQYSNIIM